jgi:hypothetical protein
MRRLPVLSLLLLTVAIAAGSAAGCGGKSHNNASQNGGTQQSQSAGKVHFAKTKFALNAGLAFGAFHRYIYKPFKSGTLGGGLLHNKKAKLKAALAAAFAYNRVKAALRDARGSKILSKALAPLLALQTKLGSMRSGLKRGDTAQIDAANTDASAAGGASSAAGQPIQDQPTPSLGG